VDPATALLDAPEMDAAVIAYARSLGAKARKAVLLAVQGKGAGALPSRRRRAIDMLGALAWPGADKRLIQLLQDGDRHVRLHAISALGYIGGGAATDRLLRLLDDQRHTDTERSIALAVLGEIGDLGTAQRLEAWATQGRPFALRIGSQRAVAAIRAAWLPANDPKLPYP
jgi:HEAT repeat protein